MRALPGMRLEATGVVRRIGGRTIVDAVDLVAEPGRITVIIGPNGAGKTTLFNCLAGHELPDGGRVLFGGTDITRLDADNRSRLGLARTFQQSTVFQTLTVQDNLLVGAENRFHNGITRGLLGIPDRTRFTDRAMVEEVLGTLGLRSLRHTLAGSLPTGTLRTVELGRALCTRPTALLLDEPASGLDDAETEELHQLLHRLAGNGLTLVLVEHDLDLVRAAADMIAVMVAGRLVAFGPPHEVLDLPEVRSAVLGVAT